MSDSPAPGLGPVNGPYRAGQGQDVPTAPLDQGWQRPQEGQAQAAWQVQPEQQPGQPAPVWQPQAGGQPLSGSPNHPVWQAQPGAGPGWQPQPGGPAAPGGPAQPGSQAPFAWQPQPGWQPTPPRPSRAPLVLTVIGLVLALLFAGSGVAAAGVKIATDRKNAPAGSLYLSGVVKAERDKAVTELLARRAKAVKDKNKDAFLADIDKSQPGLLEAQTKQYENLVKMPFSSFSYSMETARYYLSAKPELTAKYRKIVYLPAVSTKFKIAGVDSVETATPYVPIFGRVGEQWMLVGEAKPGDLDMAMPPGFGTQPWQQDPISVRVTANAVLVYSPADEDRAGGWSNLIEDSIREVKKFRPDGWPGKVYAIAVRDKKLYDEYWGKGKGDKFSAFATTRQDRIPSWSANPGTPAEESGPLVMMNPGSLEKGDSRIEAIMVHEVTHVAMQPVDKGFTPSWIVEGTAEFVESGMKTNMQIRPDWAKEHLVGKNLDELPWARTFYDDDGENYTLAWLACMMIADRYGKDKLLKLNVVFADVKDTSYETRDKAMRDTLGVSLAEFTGLWRTEVKRSINGG
ncbi:hypothetical protein AB0M43_30640 [Longispora sp. NPDC051575]|uniref:hypothetical protein n=1 Tax=Longispora sp. NPDC051575 TaxID=3154943 RepID=UPI00344A566E